MGQKEKLNLSHDTSHDVMEVGSRGWGWGSLTSGTSPLTWEKMLAVGATLLSTTL